jgi:hypothetical protein
VEPLEIPLDEFLEMLRVAEAAKDESEVAKLMNHFLFTDTCAIKKPPSKPDFTEER